MKMKHVRITPYTFMSLLATVMVLYNFRFLEFLIARAWYNWITSYSTHIVEVSVIQTNIAQDLADGQIFDLNAGAPKGYLGYAFFRTRCTIIKYHLYHYKYYHNARRSKKFIPQISLGNSGVQI